MALTLHVGNKRYSSWSLRPYLALAHAGATFETRTIWLDRPETRAAILELNPAGTVPVLEHDGLRISDSLAICEYVHELHPAAALWPAGRADRARARSVAAEMHASFATLRRELPMDLCATIVHELSAGAAADAARAMAIWRDELARSGGPFLFGTFSIADAMFAPVATRFTTYGVGLDATCQAYVAAIQGLAGFQAWRRDAAGEPLKGAPVPAAG